MIYRLLQNGRGAPLSLSPEVAAPLRVTFENAPKGANAYIKTRDGAVYYRELDGGACTFDLSHMAGDIKLGVMTTDTSEKPNRWDCGYISVFQTVQGIAAAPSAADLAEQVRSVLIYAESLYAENKYISRRVEELEKQFNEFFEGYDIL